MALLMAALGDLSASSGGTGAIGQSGATGISTGVAAATGAVSGSNVVATAEQFEGTPYVWGGTSPSGFDCSGLVQYVYGQLGVSLPRTSEEQAQVGTPVAKPVCRATGRPAFLRGLRWHGGIAGPRRDLRGQRADDRRAPHRHDCPGAVRTRQPGRGHPKGVARRNGQRISRPHQRHSGRIDPDGKRCRSCGVRGHRSNKRRRRTGSRLSSGGAPCTTRAGSSRMWSARPAQRASPSSCLPRRRAWGSIRANPTQSIEGAAQLLGSYTRQFGSYSDALAAYDAGSSAVERYGGIPPYAETQAYVPAVLSLAGLSGSLRR